MEKVIKLNVGGKVFETYVSTLAKYPDTLLGSMFTSSAKMNDDKKEFFFDRDPDYFSYILNFYRNGTSDIPVNISSDSYEAELQFWGLPSLSTDQIINITYQQLVEVMKWNDVEKDINIGNDKLKMQIKDINTKLIE